MTDPLGNPRPAETSLSDRAARSLLTSMLIALAAGAGLFLAWRAAGTFLLIFAGLLFGALLDACTRASPLCCRSGACGVWRSLAR